MKLFLILVLLAKIDKNPNITKGIWEKTYRNDNLCINICMLW